MELKDWLNSINQTKENLIDEDPSLEKEYPPYIINRCFSGHLDAIMFANEMNQYHFLPKKLQYDFYLNSLRKKKRFSPWADKIRSKTLIMSNNTMVIVMKRQSKLLKILTEEQLNFIKAKFDTGGKR